MANSKILNPKAIPSLVSSDFRGMLYLAAWRSVYDIDAWEKLIDALTDDECVQLIKYIKFTNNFKTTDADAVHSDLIH